MKYHPDNLIEYLTNWLPTFPIETLKQLTAEAFKNNPEGISFGLAFENLVRDLRGIIGLEYHKFAISDPKYVADSHHGDFTLRLFEYILCIDTKISTYTNYYGAITLKSLNNFSGWYLCCSKDLSQLCLIDADYLRAKVKTGELTTSTHLECYLSKDFEPILQEGIECNAVVKLEKSN